MVLNRKKWRQIVLSLSLLSALFLSSACASSVTVRLAYDKTARFPEYRSFAMLQPNRPVHSERLDLDPFVLQRLRQLTFSAFAARGMKPVEREQADLIVSVLAGTKRRQEVYLRSYPSYMYRGFGHYGPGFGYDVLEYEEGTVVIDLIDRRQNAVVWRGTGARRELDTLDDAGLREIIERILDQYPPEGSTARPVQEK